MRAPIIKTSLIAIAAILTLGSTLGNGTSDRKLIAKTGSLHPVAQNPAPSAVLTIEEVRYVKPPIPAIGAAYTPSEAVKPSGGKGFVMAGTNCVQCVRALTGRGQNGNAGTWRATSSTPWVGAIMIWRPGEQGASSAGHVGVVKGINPDGSIEIAHCNFPGKTTFRSTGKFF